MRANATAGARTLSLPHAQCFLTVSQCISTPSCYSVCATYTCIYLARFMLHCHSQEKVTFDLFQRNSPTAHKFYGRTSGTAQHVYTTLVSKHFSWNHLLIGTNIINANWSALTSMPNLSAWPFLTLFLTNDTELTYYEKSTLLIIQHIFQNQTIAVKERCPVWLFSISWQLSLPLGQWPSSCLWPQYYIGSTIVSLSQ